ncbi:Choline transport protein [Penicillium malachiteum]|uniref:Choline transport protein n=1 Tax=Penicillium malachiteum TaxID=1324776 RepID=UPI002548DC23|nr:Choline transport protein [Penicillium malachiteum]KAJ5721192.1 Choline transport protein [Penicillium malachiteum]
MVVYSYVCLDAATHLSEEIDKPEIHGAVLFLLIWLDLVFISTVPGALLTTGRLTWAFARDGGLPYSPFFSRISSRYEVPVYATLLSTAFCLFFGLIYIGSTVAFNTSISSAIVFAFLSYSLPQAFLLLAGRDSLPQRHFNLGKVFGTLVNFLSVAFVAFFSILFCFPFSIPTSVTAMNYVSVVAVAALLLIASLWWGAGKNRSFTGPVMVGDVLQGIEPGPHVDGTTVSPSKGWDQDDSD